MPPRRSTCPPSPRPKPTLYVHGPDAPACDPACLMWQTFFRIAGLDVDVVAASTHASPDGSLPFLLPSSADPNPDVPLSASEMARYVRARLSDPVSASELPAPKPGLDAYLALLTHRIHPAWSYALFHHHSKEPLLAKLYPPQQPPPNPPPELPRRKRTTTLPHPPNPPRRRAPSLHRSRSPPPPGRRLVLRRPSSGPLRRPRLLLHLPHSQPPGSLGP
ncbi:mitochondrial outer membrane protein (Sam35) [Ophiocordyceps camponoti-floridani]|uniref:Mitochondrial outer membrane protein (Sam35) n=1 Tax=Ophiocordyceps camponoti-floridani TaxID=2030778 RepID=A0A8H4Q9T2_9HYPO|nr:mitochondrial outer membrane protein (Sam35) [Ophiocordyceps camponoti-floridani]